MAGRCSEKSALISTYFIHFFLTSFIWFCRCIQIRNLHKVYATKKGNCCAVNSLRLTLYENQILALLGEHVQFQILPCSSAFFLSVFQIGVSDSFDFKYQHNSVCIYFSMYLINKCFLFMIMIVFIQIYAMQI